MTRQLAAVEQAALEALAERWTAEGLARDDRFDAIRGQLAAWLEAHPAPGVADAVTADAGASADPAIPPAIAAELAIGALLADGRRRQPAPGRHIEPMEIARVPTRQLIGVVARRVTRRR